MAVTAVTYNIQYGVGLDGRNDLGRIIDAVREADVVCLQEVTRGFSRNDHADMPAAIRAALPTHFSAYHPAADVDGGSTVEDGTIITRRFQFGNMILARWPLRYVRGHLLPRSWRKDKFNIQRGALEALIDTPVGPIRFFSVHLDHIDARERMAQIRALKPIALEFAQAGGAVTGAGSLGIPDMADTGDFLLMGDFNFEPDSDEHELIIENGAVVDATAADPGWSWRSAFDKPLRRQRLDYAFGNPSLVRRITAMRIDRAREGSDHMPVWVTIGP